ncbi:MAG: hypothetical protein EPN73_25245 [Paraburkholderia sp.]|uniref:hypothetical protein n=1 Tax=Paraburkholderia sp. TaxID=1926495 RepID=UPI0011FABB5F|nr:hypothetical protein [Paraburkholderia sp.]TAL92543.1 MAG: hypothetical protein EPN73_25245 [Paraburkholderia sp.]
MDAKREALLFARLIAPMLKHLKRIAGSTQGEYTVDDLKSEAWLVFADLREHLGEDVEPEDEQLQSTVIAKIQKFFGRFVNRPMRFAARLDRDDVDDDGDFVTNSIAARLSAPEAYEPHVAFEQREESDEARRVLGARFSEAVAYLRVLDHFDGEKPVIARYLEIHSRTLDARLMRAETFAKLQPSMFDGIEVLPDDFLPRRGVVRRRVAVIGFHRVCDKVRPWQTHLFSRAGSILLRS